MQNILFANVEELPRDPILGLTEAFVADKNPAKVNLGVGVYQDATGKVPLLACVKQAEEALVAKAAPHAYIPIDGIAGYNSAVARMVFAESADIARIATVQALGGTGALKLGAELLKVATPQAKVWISDPSWENHRALFAAAGFAVETYPYYGDDGELDFAGLIAALDKFRLATSSCCTPAAITRPASTCRRPSGERSPALSAGAGSRPSWTRHIWVLPRDWRPTLSPSGSLREMAALCSCPSPSPSRFRFTASALAP